MTLVEFLAPLTNGTNRDKVLATMFFAREYENEAVFTVPRLREQLLLARVRGARKMNIADVLARAGHLVTKVGVGDRGVGQWSLTDTGVDHVRELVGVPTVGAAVGREVATLEALASRIADETVRGYVDEAIVCLKAGALRASVVFVWSGAIRHLQDAALGAYGGTTVSAALRKHDPKSRGVSKVADFSGVRDLVTLLGFRELGLLDKGEWQTLQEALDLRNRCGHPTKYRPGLAKVASFIEDVVGIAFV